MTQTEKAVAGTVVEQLNTACDATSHVGAGLCPGGQLHPGLSDFELTQLHFSSTHSVPSSHLSGPQTHVAHNQALGSF